MHWQPSSRIETLKKRAQLIQRIRAFFTSRHYLEVDTPLLSQYTVTDRHIDSIPCQISPTSKPFYLQTSPEYSMKRLLAANSGPIFQICKAFRQEEIGHQHHHEFTLLEWYRPGFTHMELMQEVSQLLSTCLGTEAADSLTYHDVFTQELGISPHTISTSALQQAVKQHQLYDSADTLDHDTCLQLLMSELIEPKLGQQRPVMIYHYPASQAALAKINTDHSPAVAERFELYYQGRELGNGFHELNDPNEQRQRFHSDQQYRQQHQRPSVDIDEDFLACLTALPACAGVAIGIDRLLMLHLDLPRIDEVISFR